jgi:hypothetical protein
VNINYKHHSWNSRLGHRITRHRRRSWKWKSYHCSWAWKVPEIYKMQLTKIPVIIHDEFTLYKSHQTAYNVLRYIHTSGAVHKMEELSKICKGVPTASTSCFWFRKLRDIVQALIQHPCTQNPQFGLVYRLSGAMKSEPTDITTQHTDR